jgi:hypothetical protein
VDAAQGASMDDLINEVVQRIGITTLQAEERVTISVA